MPSSRSVSETTHSLSSNRRMTARSTQQPPTMMSLRSRGRPGLCTRSARRSVASVRNTSSAAARVSTKRCSASRSYSARPISTAAIVVMVPPMPTSVAASRHRGQLAEHVVEVRVDEREGVAQLLGRGWIGLQLLLGQADAADRDRYSPVERGRAGRELGRPATDVEDQERRERLVELARRAEEPIAPFLDAVDHLDGRSQHLGSPAREVSAVGRLAHGLGRHRAHPASPVRFDEVAVLGEHLESAGDAVRVERPGAVGCSTEPGHDHPALERDRARLHEQADRVRPAVDDRDGRAERQQLRAQLRPRPTCRRDRRTPRDGRRSARAGTSRPAGCLRRRRRAADRRDRAGWPRHARPRTRACGRREVVRVDCTLCCSHAAPRLEPAHGF